MSYTSAENKIEDYRYHALLENLTLQEIANFTCRIQESERYSIGHLGHIFITGTEKVIGYIGEDRIDLIDNSQKLIPQHKLSLIELLSEALC